jgi:hypothetical protein
MRQLRRCIYICRENCINLKGKIMKALIATIVSAFALTAFAAEPAKAPATATSAPAKAEVKKDEKKPGKSTPAKKDAKATANTAKAAK